MNKERETAVLKNQSKEGKFSRLSLALKNNLLRRKSRGKLPAKQEDLKSKKL